MTRLVTGAATVTGCAGAGWWFSRGVKDDLALCLRPPGALPEHEFLCDLCAH